MLLMAGGAVAGATGAPWYGWDYWAVGRFLSPPMTPL